MSEPADLLALLDRLDEARAAATPGPWHVMRSTDDRRAYAITAGRVVTDSAGCSTPDAACIVAEHNAVPALVAALRNVLAVAEELEAWAGENDSCEPTDTDGLLRSITAGRVTRRIVAEVRTALAVGGAT